MRSLTSSLPGMTGGRARYEATEMRPSRIITYVVASDVRLFNRCIDECMILWMLELLKAWRVQSVSCPRHARGRLPYLRLALDKGEKRRVENIRSLSTFHVTSRCPPVYKTPRHPLLSRSTVPLLTTHNGLPASVPSPATEEFGFLADVEAFPIRLCPRGYHLLPTSR